MNPIGAGLWAADPHEYGPGKVHIVDAENRDKTLCGKWLRAVPGKSIPGGRATCRICLNAVENRAHRRVLDEQYKREQEQRDRERAEQSKEWWARYDAYMRSPQWREKRDAVMRRAGGFCEGCGKERATQVHHLTYAHLCAEFLWELRAVCTPCHERIHQEMEAV